MHAEKGKSQKPALPEPLKAADRTCVWFAGRKLAYFGGCDYYRLSSHPEISGAFIEGLARYGFSVSASRRTTGNHTLYERFERQLASFFQAPAAVLVGAGYFTNLVAAQALQDEVDLALIDRRAHASLKDAAAFLGCDVLEFPHRDTAALVQTWKRAGKPDRALVLTDGLFAHDGTLAPLRDYLQALPGTVRVIVDDAHGAGTIGPAGRGTLEHYGVGRARVIQTITLSKAFGVFGGAILGSTALRQKIQTRSAIFAGQTPLPLPLVYAGMRSLKLLQKDRALAARLRRNTRYVKENLTGSRLPMANTPGPIVSLIPQTPRQSRHLRKRLLSEGVYPSLIQYPSGPPAGYYRFALSSEHTREQLDALCRALNGAR